MRSVEVPTRMVHGPGALARLGELQRELGIARPLLVTDKGVAAAGLVDRALEQLDGAVLFDGVRPNPDIELVGEGSAAYREAGCDGLVALGGGSSIDAAKAIGVEVVHGGSILEYEYGGTPIDEARAAARRDPDHRGNRQRGDALGRDHRPRAADQVQRRRDAADRRRTSALIDPELMLGLPPAVTAATGLDALSHGIECYTCDYHQPFNDAVALHAIELVGGWLRAAFEDGSNLEARTHMAHAATLGGMAYGTESAGAAHAMSQSAGGVHDCPHGALTARVLGPVCELQRRRPRPSATRGSRRRSASTRPEWTSTRRRTPGWRRSTRLTDDVGIPSMAELGFSEDEIPMLARIAYEDPQTIGNAREVDVAAYEEIYREAFASMSTATRDYGMVIGGVWTDSDARLEATSPAQRRVARLGAGGDARGRAAGDRGRERRLARLVAPLGLRARGGDGAGRRPDRRAARRARADADARSGQAAAQRVVRRGGRADRVLAHGGRRT